jgi:hypothetical protein
MSTQRSAKTPKVVTEAALTEADSRMTRLYM